MGRGAGGQFWDHFGRILYDFYISLIKKMKIIKQVFFLFVCLVAVFVYLAGDVEGRGTILGSFYIFSQDLISIVLKKHPV